MSDVRTVLIADDEPDAIAIVESVLSEIDGIETISAPDGNAALARATTDGPDMIILDVQMPGRNGFEVFAELKKDAQLRDIPVIMLTGIREKAGMGFSKENMGEFLGVEPEAYLEKPIDPEELLKNARKILGL